VCFGLFVFSQLSVHPPPPPPLAWVIRSTLWLLLLRSYGSQLFIFVHNAKFVNVMAGGTYNYLCTSEVNVLPCLQHNHLYISSEGSVAVVNIGSDLLVFWWRPFFFLEFGGEGCGKQKRLQNSTYSPKYLHIF
jgi:hypothetical protein